MNGFSDALVYLNDPFNWTRPGGILDLLAVHLTISVVAVLAAFVLAFPIGVALGTSGRGGGAVVVISNVSRAMPTLALLTLFAVSAIGFGNKATTIALAVFAFPPILTNTYVGFRGVDPDIREAARAMGLSRGQVIRRVDLPLALPLVMTGLRTAAVQVVATAGLAALVGGGGLGRIVNLGFGQQDYGLIIAGAILIAALALLTELLLVLLTWAVTPGPRHFPLLRPRTAPAMGEPEPVAAVAALTRVRITNPQQRAPQVHRAQPTGVAWRVRETSRQTRVAATGRTGHRRRALMHTRIRFIAPLIAAVALTAACGDSGSSGTGGGSESSGNASGDACAPVAGDKLVVLEDDKRLQNADNVIPAVNAAFARASRPCCRR